MAYGNWKYVTNEYENTFLKLSYPEHAKAFTRLIPQLKKVVSPALIPGVSLGNLFLEHPDKTYCIRIMHLKPGRFNVYCEQSADGSRTFESEASEEEVVEIVKSLQSEMNLADADE